MALKQVVMSGLAWSAGAKFLTQLITWGVTIVVIRLLTPTDYGLMALATVFVAFLAMLKELGLGAAIVQRKDLDHDTLRAIFGIVLLACVSFYIILASAAPLIAGFYDEEPLVLLIRVLALQFLVMGFSIIPSSLLLRNMEFRKIAIVNFSSLISGSLTTLAFALAGYGVWSLVWGSLVIQLVSVVGYNIACPFLYLPLFKLKGMQAVFSFGGYVTLSRVIWFFYNRADTLIVGKMLGKDLLGYYSIGFFLASLPMEKVSGIINQVAFPAFSSVQSDPSLAARHFLKAVRVLCFISVPVLWGISSIAPEIVGVFLGNRWSDSVLTLQIIALIIPVRMISNLNNPAVLGAGRADIAVYNSLSGFTFMPVAFFAGSFFGLLGVSLAWLIVFPVVFLINFARLRKVMEITFKDIFYAMRSPFAAGVVMYAGVFALRQSGLLDIQMIPKMLIFIGWGALIYSLMTVFLNKKGLREAMDLIKR